MGAGIAGSEDRAAIAERAQILGGIETQRGHLSGEPGRHGLEAGADGLHAIFHHAALEFLTQGFQALHIEGVPVEVDRHEIADVRPAPRTLLAGVEIDLAVGVGIHEDRDGSQIENGERGGEGRKRRGQHLIAGPAAERLE